MGKDLKGKELGVGLFQRKDKRYSARFTNRYGRRMQFYHEKLSVVRKWLNDAKYEDEHGLAGTGEKVCVSEWFWQWIKLYKEGVVKDNTVKNYKSRFKFSIEPAIGTMQLTKVKKIHLQTILNNMYDEGYAYGTMVLTQITMHALFDGAVQSEILTKNPADGLKCKQRDVKEARVLTRQEQEEFLEYCKGCMYYNAYVLFLQTGLRPGELGGLKWEDINLEKKELHVERTLLQDKSKGGFYFGSPKNKMSKRTVPLTDTAIKILKDQRIYQFKLRQRSNNWQKNKEFDNLVFCTVNGNPVGDSTLRMMMLRVITRINIDRRAEAELNNTTFVEFEPAHPHTLRHTFATRCIEDGVKPNVLQKILGHASITITMGLYVHETHEEKHGEIRKLGGIEENGVKVV